MRTILEDKKLWHYLCPQEAHIVVELVKITKELKREKRQSFNNYHPISKGQCVAPYTNFEELDVA